MIKNITKEEFFQFAKIGGIDDHILVRAHPARCVHSPASLLSIKDMENTVKLDVTTVKNVPKCF